MIRSKQRALVLILAVALIGGLSGCGNNPGRAVAFYIYNTGVAVLPPPGLLYTNVRAPVTAQAPASLGTRSGSATVNQIAIPPIPGIMPAIPLISWGDVSKEEAARNGGLTDVTHMDYQLTSILMFYRRFKLTAYGN